ncbi:MAG TPA: formate--tetrahydrofolate ligase [Clostridiaceae bacterium]|nr:formate--tetrahydrofolate ligase [Clostridiaceae bacterium]
MMQDIEIARNAKLKNINEIADSLKINEEYLEQYGKYKAKISLNYYEKIKDNKDGKLILVTAINPTPLGEGKTTTSIGLTDAFNKLNKKAILALREPSLGPVFGIKGGATGGGYSQVAPMEDINLHFTGDIHAITTANNLLSAIIDNHIWQGNELEIEKVTWKRCLDLNDRALRKVQISLSGERNMLPREDGFDITVASEIMAILCLAKDMKDLKRRLGNIIIGYNKQNNPITCKDLKAEGSLAVILKDAINPNLVQTLENNPVLIHGGPFANIAHGCNSVIATNMALKMGDYVITEAGFGADLGAEKFLDIKCRLLNKKPNAVVIVATLRALKYHGGVSKEECTKENVEALKVGIQNLLRHIENVKKYGVTPIVAINKFSNDTEKEIETLKQTLEGIVEVSLLENWEKGGEGATDLANKLIKICETENGFEYIYDINDTIEEKIKKVAQKIYGATGVEYSDLAKEQLKELNNFKMPICVAKTQYSFSDDPKDLLGDKPFNLHVTELKMKAGAEFVVVLTGKIMTMPGLPKKPAAENINIDDNGIITGIF